MLHSYRLSQNRSLPINNKTGQLFKLIFNNDRWEMIPRESYIRDFLAPIKESLLKNRGLTLRPYAGTLQPEEEEEIEELPRDIVDEYVTYPEHHIANCVEELPIFFTDESLPDMKNGHLLAKNYIKRAYTLESETYQPIACIDFTINLKNRHGYIHVVSVHPERQGEGLGAILVDIAVIVSSLYRCQKISLSANDLGIMTYLKNGFFVYEDLPWQHFSTLNDAAIQAIIDKYSGIPMALYFEHPETQAILRTAFLRYLHPHKDILSDLLTQQGIYDILQQKWLKIMNQYHSLLQSRTPQKEQQYVEIIDNFAKSVRIPASFLTHFASVIADQSGSRDHTVQRKQAFLQP